MHACIVTPGSDKLEGYMKIMELPDVELSEACQDMMNSISSSHSSCIELRKSIRTDILKGGVFDPVVHAYLAFVETFTRHL